MGGLVGSGRSDGGGWLGRKGGGLELHPKPLHPPCRARGVGVAVPLKAEEKDLFLRTKPLFLTRGKAVVHILGELCTFFGDLCTG